LVLRITPNTAGFSLIEMMVVVAILSVLAVGATLTAGRGGTAADRAASALVADATQTRHLAMQSGLDHALIFQADGWQIARRTGTGWAALRDVTPRGLRVTGPQAATPWVLGSDGRVASGTITLAAGTWRLTCRASDGALPRCL
jgi:type II secretion system protein H